MVRFAAAVQALTATGTQAHPGALDDLSNKLHSATIRHFDFLESLFGTDHPASGVLTQ